ncbi:MAG: hypothetical protein LUH15_14850 [Tannerellaceae bacterium]|nr:hypothetical protein [Tannerellaceae bacterium]
MKKLICGCFVFLLIACNHKNINNEVQEAQLVKIDLTKKTHRKMRKSLLVKFLLYG